MIIFLKQEKEKGSKASSLILGSSGMGDKERKDTKVKLERILQPSPVPETDH